MTVDEMRTHLATEYGIHNDAELEAALKKIGGINIAVFVTDPKEVTKANCKQVRKGAKSR